MNKIIITNNGTIISPYRKHMLKDLEWSTSSYDNVYHKTNEITGFQMEYNGVNSFITHNMDRMSLQNLLPNYQIEEMPRTELRRMTQEFELNSDITPNENQYSITQDILNDIAKNTRVSHEWFVNLQTGFGKTLLSIYLSSLIKYKTLIMCYSTEILRQWIKAIHKSTTFDMSRILFIDSSKLLDLMYMNEFDTIKYDIFMCTPKLLTSYASKHGTEKLQNIFSNIGIGLKIFDEAHKNKSNIVKINALTNVKYTLYLSADYAQADPRVEKMYYKIFKNCYILKPKDEHTRDMRYTKAVVVEFNSHPDLIESESIFNRYGFSSQFYMKYEFEKKIIFDVIQYIIDTILKTEIDHKILILVTNIDHVDILDNLLNAKYHDQLNIGRYHSQVNEEEKEYTINHCNLIISTYSSFGTGMDVNDIKYVITLNQSNKIEDNQAAGRARPLKDGSDAFYFMIVDRGFKYCTKKLKIRLGYLQETKVKQILHLKYEV